MEDRIIELESKVAYHEREIEKLTEALTEQERQVDRLNKTLKALADRLPGAESPTQESGGESSSNTF
jgi:uncharacterized coiled-coil protein SlyX